MKKFMSLIIFSMMFFAIACKEECQTEIKYKDPTDLTIKLGESLTTFHNYQITLKSIEFKKNPPIDTLVSKDSVTVAISCVFMMMHSDSSNVSEFRVVPGNSALYGNSTLQEGQLFEHVKITCNGLNVNPASASLTVWDASFLQDCNPW